MSGGGGAGAGGAGAGGAGAGGWYAVEKKRPILICQKTWS